MGKHEELVSHNIGRYDMKIGNAFMECRVFWARIVGSESESLLTSYTKHTFFEIQYALNGRIGMTVGDSQYLHVDESDFVIIPPDTYHQVVDSDSIGARFIMAFSVSPLQDRFREILHRLSHIETRHETPRMRQLLSMMREEEGVGMLGRRMLDNLIEAFLLEIFSVVCDTPHQSVCDADDTTQRVASILRYIHSKNGIDLHVSDVARAFNISERHLSRLLIESTGRSPKEQINHEKLKKIEELVLSTSLSLSEISELCGFCDEYAMNKFFRRHTQANLSSFRRISQKSKS